MPRMWLFIAVAVLCASLTGCQNPDADYEQQFQNRSDFYIRQTALRQPDKLLEWFDANSYFHNGGGDPHKYAMPTVLARLHRDPDDEQALKLYRFLMDVDTKKGDRGLYHFAAYTKARLYLMGRGELPKDVLESMEHDVRNYGHILTRGGTENHTWMHRANGYILAEQIDGDYADRMPRERLKAQTRAWLISQIKKLYTNGQGEYDSSTYVGFSIASLCNVYDYTDDPEMKAWAKAGLDWMAAALALKYFHGCQLGPEARGFATRAVGNVDQPASFPGAKHFEYSQVGTHTDWVCWLWFGDSAGNVMLESTKAETNRFPAIVPALSSYRPPEVIRRIARKQIDLPLSARNAKSSYWADRAGKDQEVLYFAKPFAMGTLYSPEKGVRTSGTILPQTTMLKICLLGPDDVYTFGASNGYHGHFPLEGRTPYDQYHQHGPAAINICWVDAKEDDRTKHRSVFGYRSKAGQPVSKSGWFFWQVKDAYLAARPLNGKAAPGEVTHIKKGKAVPVESDTHSWLVSPGKLGGWAVQLGGKADHATLADFQQAVLDKVKLDLSAFDSNRTVTMTTLAGDTLKMTHTGGPGARPDAWVNGEPLDYDAFPVYGSDVLKQPKGSGVLTIAAGDRRLVIDTTGDVPQFTYTGPDGKPLFGCPMHPEQEAPSARACPTCGRMMTPIQKTFVQDAK